MRTNAWGFCDIQLNWQNLWWLFCSGDPVLFEAFWRANPDLGTAVIPGWYRVGYSPKPGATSFYNDAFMDSIRGLHALVGNAVTEGRYILAGTGSMQLINAVVHSLALQNPETVSPVVARAPYYSVRILPGCLVYTTLLPITYSCFFIRCMLQSVSETHVRESFIFKGLT